VRASSKRYRSRSERRYEAQPFSHSVEIGDEGEAFDEASSSWADSAHPDGSTTPSRALERRNSRRSHVGWAGRAFGW